MKIVMNQEALEKYVKVKAYLIEGDFTIFNVTQKALNLNRCDEDVFSYPFEMASYCIEKG